MIFLCQLTVYLFLCVNIIKGEGVHYTPDWKSLDARPLPPWYDNAKIGIFIHWGVYSVPSYDSEWFWINWHLNVSDIGTFMKKNYRPGFTYQEFASDFTAELFDPFKWAKLFEASGAEYVILTSKHHEGYALWPSKYSYSWNSVDVGPKRDLIGELAAAIRDKTKLHFGLYHSLFEWFHPLYLNDKDNNFTTQQFVTDKIIPELKELVYQYRPDIIWSDGEWEAPDSYWKSKEFLAWLYNESPVKKTVVVNDRWGSNTLCKHGGFMTCSDRYNPGVLQKKKWENAFTIDSRSWGFRRNADIKDFLTSAEMIALLAQAVSCNGNIAMNIGPAKDGMISPIYQERLLDMGKWLKVNGPAIYGSRPWIVCQNDTQTPAVWYTTKKTPERKVDLYAIVLNWPTKEKLLLGCPQMTEASKVTMLGVHQELKWTNDSNNTVLIEFPSRSVVRTDWAWVLKITGVLNIMRLEQNN